MEFKILDNQGKLSKKTLTASDATFGIDFNEDLIHKLVVSYMSNSRSGTRAQKTRSEVKHSTRKPFRQKGTGNARAGMTSSPIWRGGGRAFPNRTDENFIKKINKKAYRAGMKSILSELVRQDRLSIIEEFKVKAPKTKDFIEKIKSLGVTDKALILVDSFDENLFLSSRNVPHILVIEARYADPVSLVHFPKVIATAGSVKQLEEMFS
ncbi:MAG: 50S ribosomal protein L4 [Nitrosomonadales bacterium]|nr:50S ribosomal protein L4 [Nitrosomonadales bacterium]|tara:strand:+ start:32 stop:658 length:627 start_codon:yes stop_codon:yes gene_type:complete